MAQTAVSVDSLTKEFGNLVAVDDLSFEIEEGEFFTFLGPSGCGKTTTLRMLAGFEAPTTGRIEIGDEDVTASPPYERDVGMVFQSYALFPHKTVGENVAFGLKMEGVGKTERKERADEALEMVDLGGFADRSPTELSGGQQQRVALARALVIQPDVLLLDEPLANLDLKLRQQMRFELKRIQEDLGITTVYVTHDQQEALSMSDRILVMNNGRAEQNDDPLGLYNNPANGFVADFIGEANLLQGRLQQHDDEGVRIDLTDIENNAVVLDDPGVDAGVEPGDEVVLNIRPEDIEIATSETAYLTGTITERTFYGQSTTFHVDIGGRQLRIDSFGRDSQVEYNVGETIAVRWNPENCQVLRGDA